MRWFDSRKATRDDWIEAIRPELREMPVPAPRDELLARIVASRAAGDLVILPDGGRVVEPGRTRGVVALFAAVVVLLLIPFARGAIFRTRGGDMSAREDAAASGWLFSLSATVAFAQTEPDAHRAIVSPVVIAFPERLRPVTLQYQRTWHDSTGRITGRADGTVALRPDSVDGTPAWRLVSAHSGVRDGRAFRTVDSVYVARSDVRLLQRVAIQAPYSRYDEIRVQQRFSGDSVLGRMHAKGADASAAGRPIARRLPPSAVPYVVDAFAPVLFAAVDLHAGWRGTMALVGWAVVDPDVRIPVALQVDGTEVISVPAGRFDCWRLTVQYVGRTLHYWVRKSDGLAVRSLQPDGDGIVRDIVLSRIGS